MRIILPTTAAGWKKLHDGIKKKHDADAGASPLHVLLAEESINMDDDNEDLGTAVTHHDSFIIARNQAEELREDRDDFFTLPFSAMKKSAQFLKSLHKSNVRKLGEWGFTVNHKSQLVYPPDFISRYKLFGTFYAKHLSFPAGTTSPLDGFLNENNIDLNQLNKDADKANTIHEDFGTAEKKSELEKQLRDTAMKAHVANTKTICQFLIEYFATKPKKLGLYGITVDDSPRGVVRRKSKLAPGAQKTITAAHINRGG